VGTHLEQRCPVKFDIREAKLAYLASLDHSRLDRAPCECVIWFSAFAMSPMTTGSEAEILCKQDIRAAE